MGLGKIVGLGDFDITWSSTPDYTFDNYYFISPHIPIIFPIGRTVTISKDTVSTDFWNRVITMGQIKFVLYGSRGTNGGSTRYGTGGAGSNGSVATVKYKVSSSADSFVLELGGSTHHTDKGGEGGIGPEPQLNAEPENKGESGVHGGGGGGCSGESHARYVYTPETGKVLHTYRGANGGRGGHGCSVYVKRGGSTVTSRLGTACGGGGGGGAAGFLNAGNLDGEGGLAGRPALIVNGVVQPGAGGNFQREDDKPDGQNATSPTGYTSPRGQPLIEVYAPIW